MSATKCGNWMVRLIALGGLTTLALTGCGSHDCESCAAATSARTTTAGSSEAEDEIRANRAKLSPEDRRLVEAQEFCPVMDDSRLGGMGPPLKVLLKDKDGKEHTVFVCCKGCLKKAEKYPEKTLAKVEELKAKVKAGPPKP